MAAIVASGDRNAAASISSCLIEKGVAIAPCDTIYGILGCVPDAEGRIRELKGRGEQKPFLVLHSAVNSIIDLAIEAIPAVVLALLPGPLTLIVPTKEGKIGLRVPADDFLRTVLERTGPLFSTSVNLSGDPPMWRINEIKERFSEKVDIIVDGGDLASKVPSTILDISEKPFTIVRPGAVLLPEEVLRLCR
jgi:L-threonylcarbamoyladenylate synthase